MGDVGDGGARYRAFISYSHVDKAFGQRLHRRLEHYGLPRHLVGRTTARGPVPRRVVPVFRDREEFSAAGDLTAEVRAALAASGALIVVCSPAAAASPWVSREVELFRELHPDRPVLAALIGGAPAEAFPRPLTLAGGAPVEPLAADFRAEGDGPGLALLKLVAGVLGLGLDQLVQRDAQQRLRRVTAITAGALAATLAMGTLTTFALWQRAEARKQRAQAEALVEFMLTDLRDRLKGVGRLDVLTSVNARTLKYYEGQDVTRLSAESQMRYARILQAMGEDDMTRGEAGTALAKFKAANAVTEPLLAAVPDNPERMWAQGQSDYWLGFHAYQASDRETARRFWHKYRDRSASLVKKDRRNASYTRELAYAYGNICSLLLKRPQEPALAVEACRTSLTEMLRAKTLSVDRPELSGDLVNRYGWMAQAYAANDELEKASRVRAIQERLLSQQISSDPKDMKLKQAWVVLQTEIAALEVRGGGDVIPFQRLLSAQNEVAKLRKTEPENKNWIVLENRLEKATEYMKNVRN